MPSVAANDLFRCARRVGFSVGIFDVLDLAFLTAATSAATNTQSPVIFNVRLAADDAAHADYLLAAAACAARQLDTPAAVCAEGVTSAAEVRRVLALGANLIRTGIPLGPVADLLDRTRAIVAGGARGRSG